MSAELIAGTARDYKSGMAETDTFQPYAERSNWIRLRTLIIVRWIAIFGQLAAIFVATMLFALDLDLGLCLAVVGAAVVSNLVMVFVYPENHRLSETEAAGALVFDLCQLGLLLFLTGGLNNPFAVLFLAPVAISATALKPGTVAAVAGVAVVFVIVLSRIHHPLRTADGMILAMPGLFVFGFAVAIITGVIFLSVYAGRVTGELHAMSEALAATQMALAREQKLTDLGGVVAAAAHELGTPLATIKLASAELIDELDGQSELQDDARLIRDQADRCRDILRSMGQVGKDDLHMRLAPLGAVVREAAEPHADRGKALHYDIGAIRDGAYEQPIVERRPEVIHGLRNLVQNAVDFARDNVWVDAHWDADHVLVRVVDDGPGYPAQIINRIGDPFVSRRSGRRRQSSGYDGMGLGLFIAKTLLERAGASVTFANGHGDREADARCGAIVEVRWSRKTIERFGDARRALGENVPILP